MSDPWISNREMVSTLANGGKAPMSWNEAGLIEEEADRVVSSALLAFYAIQVPRRTGQAGRAAARDKKIGKIIAYGYLTLWRDMNHAREAPKAPDDYEAGEMAARDPSCRKAGATVQWPKWLDKRKKYLMTRERSLAAFARREGNWKWGGRRLRNLRRELSAIERALELLEE